MDAKFNVNAAASWVGQRLSEVKETATERLAAVMESTQNVKDKFDRTVALNADLSRPVAPARAASPEARGRALNAVSDYFRCWSTADGNWKKESVQHLYHPNATVSDIPPDLKKLASGQVTFDYHDIGQYLQQMQDGLYSHFKEVKLTFDPSAAKVEKLGRGYLRVTVPFENRLQARSPSHLPAMHMSGVAQLVLDRDMKIRSEELVIRKK